MSIFSREPHILIQLTKRRHGDSRNRGDSHGRREEVRDFLSNLQLNSKFA